MTEKVSIGLLTPFFQPIPGYERAAVNLGINLVIVTPNNIHWPTGELTGLVFTDKEWVTQEVPLPSAYYNRYYGPKPKVVSRLELVVGKNKVFNHITRFNKWKIHQILSSSPLKQFLPVSSSYSPEELRRFLDQFGQVIIKPKTGQLGNRVYLIKKNNNTYDFHQGTKSPVASFHSWQNLLEGISPHVTNSFLLQQFVTLSAVNGRVFDLRILLQKDGQGVWQATGALTRFALRYSYITNLAQAIEPASETLERVFPGQRLMTKLEEISIQAAQLVEQSLGSLGEISVDFGLDQQGRIWIIELNSKPMKNTFSALGDPKLMQTIYEQPLRYALYLATSRPS